jgi:hypothetical protein
MQQMCLKVLGYLCGAWGRTGTAFSLPSKGPAFWLLLVWPAKMSMHQVVQKARIGPGLPWFTTEWGVLKAPTPRLRLRLGRLPTLGAFLAPAPPQPQH